MALRLRRVGQEGMDFAADQGRRCRFALRRRHQSFLGRTLRKDNRGERTLGQTLRQHPQRLVQGPRHDRARVAGQADDFRRRADQSRRLRLHGRHLGGAGHLLRRGGHPVHRAPPARENFRRAAHPADFQRRPRAVSRHRLRRLHAAGPGNHQGRNALPGELDEFAAG